MRDLRGELMKREGGYEADDAGWHPECHRHEVRLPHLRQLGQAVEGTRQGHQKAAVSQRVERSGVNPRSEGFSGPDHAATVPAQATHHFSSFF